VFVTPRIGDGEQGHDWGRPAATADTVVLYMAGRQAGAISAGLLAAGVPAARPAVFVENASLPSRKVIPARVGALAEAAAALGDGPALRLIGEVYGALRAAEVDEPAQRRVA
jgi:siroheme synthase